MSASTRALVAATLFLLPALDLRGQTAAAPPPPHPEIRRLARMVRDADLRGQWAELGRAHDALAALEVDAAQGPWVAYYLAYADWRRSSLAWMGEGPGGTAALQRQCAGHLDRALAQTPGFTDALALLVMCEATMASGMPDSIPAIMARVGANLQRLAAVAPDHPRARLIRYLLTSFSPRTPNEQREATLRDWRTLARDFPTPGPGEPEWGDAESWGWLGMVLLARGQPAAAEEAMTQALAKRPDFWWIREIALPQARSSRLPHRGE